VKTSLNDGDSYRRALDALARVEREFKPAIREALLGCAERVSVIARGSYLRGPKPERLRSRVGKATGYGGERVSGGGRLEKSLIVHGGGYEGLAAVKAERDSILEFHVSGDDRIALEYGTEVPYAALWEYGPQTRIIVPVRAKALRFVTETGQVVFTKRVKQTPGHREFLGPGLRDAEPAFPDIIGKKLAKALEKYAGN
jgi:hypothetical protein